MSLHWPILRQCLRSARKPLITDDVRSYRGIEIIVAAMHLADYLAPRCAAPTLGVLIPTSGAFPIAALAGWILGKTVVPLNYVLSQDELQFIIDDCETDTVVTVQPLLDHLGFAPRVKNLVRLSDVSFKGFPTPRWPARADAEDLAVLLYTSGTSGRPKGVMLTHANLQANIAQVMQWAEFDQSDTMLGVLPQFHSFGLTVLTLLPLTIGCRAVYAARFVPTKIVRTLREHRPTVLVAIPSMYNALLALKSAEPDDFSSLRYTVSGGEPLPEAIFRGFRDRFGVTINEGYGLTETSPVTNWCRPHEWRPHSVGRPLPGVRERIVAWDTGLDLPANMDGEVRIAGPNVMRGYFKRPEETAAVFDEQGFFQTGDIGRLDDDGHLYITGRLKEMLIIAGENVFPREIEEVLNQHPAVAGSGVVGAQDPSRGEVPVAFVEVREGMSLDERTLLAFCRDRLAGYKIPREVRFLDALPRNPTGKILRRQLKTML